MRSMHPVLKRGGLFWDHALLPAKNYEARFRRLQGAITEAGDDAWLLYGDVERYGAVAWFSNFLPRTRSALAVVPREGAPTLLLAVGLRDVPAAKTLTWVEDVRPFTRLPGALADLLAEKGLSRARLGLAGVEELLPIKSWNEIAGLLPEVKFVPRSDDVAAMRARKDDREIAAVRNAAAIVAAALAEGQAAVRAGRTMREVTAVIDRACRVRAAEDVRLMVASGEQAGQSLRPADDRKLARGDAVLVHLAVEAQRYWAEGARTFVVGAPDAAVSALHARAEQVLIAMRAAIKPGARGGDVAQAARVALGDEAIVASAAGYGLGAGVGLETEETPRIALDSADDIADRSAIALRVIAHSNGRGVALAETIVARDGGVERLNASRGLIQCG